MGIHGREEVGGGFVMGSGLFLDPVHAQAVAEASKHSHKEHGAGFAHAAQVVEVADIETLMESALNAPRLPVEFEPVQGSELLWRSTGEQLHRVGLFAVGDPGQPGGLSHQGKVGAFGTNGSTDESPDFVPAFV